LYDSERTEENAKTRKSEEREMERTVDEEARKPGRRTIAFPDFLASLWIRFAFALSRFRAFAFSSAFAGCGREQQRGW
jgi:hypothetical protein